MNRFLVTLLALVFGLFVAACGGGEKSVSLSDDSASKPREESDSGEYDKEKGGEEKEEAPKPEGAIKINEVTAEELAAYKISGLGEKTAEKIVEYREENGPFKNMEDLDGAPRVGEKMLEKLEEQGIDFGDAAAESGESSEKEATASEGEDKTETKSSSRSKEDSGATGKKVNINEADAKELQTVKGIGEVSAQRIIDYREENGPFKSIEDIQEVKGFGEKTFEKIRDRITVD